MALQSNILRQFSGDYGVWWVRASEEVWTNSKAKKSSRLSMSIVRYGLSAKTTIWREYLSKQNLTPNQTAIIRGDKRHGAGLKDK